jgi:hypothetical protein
LGFPAMPMIVAERSIPVATGIKKAKPTDIYL